MTSVKQILGLVVSVLLLLPYVGPTMPVAQGTRPVVVLDPGHGRNSGSGIIDPGAVSDDLIEKDITLDVARHTRAFLSRCPVDVFLTRDGDDAEHTLSDVAELVNRHQPTVAVAIHVNSTEGNPSGTEAFYTDGGYDDAGSQRLATLLSGNIAARFSIHNRGAKLETSTRHGGLYIHDWQAPSALVEIAFLQGDATLLRERRADFGRAIAQAILAYLDLPVTCADTAVLQGVLIAAYFPGDTGSNQIELLNDGLATWQPGDYVLKSVAERYGAEAAYPLPNAVEPGKIATWKIPARVPSTPGIYWQAWQLYRGDVKVGPEVRVTLIVVPEDARELKEKIEQQIEEWRKRGEEEIDKFIADLEEEIRKWIESEIERGIEQCCGTNAVIIGSVVSAIVWQQVKRRRPRR